MERVAIRAVLGIAPSKCDLMCVMQVLDAVTGQVAASGTLSSDTHAHVLLVPGANDQHPVALALSWATG